MKAADGFRGFEDPVETGSAKEVFVDSGFDDFGGEELFLDFIPAVSKAKGTKGITFGLFFVFGTDVGMFAFQEGAIAFMELVDGEGEDAALLITQGDIGLIAFEKFRLQRALAIGALPSAHFTRSEPQRMVRKRIGDRTIFTKTITWLSGKLFAKNFREVQKKPGRKTNRAIRKLLPQQGLPRLSASVVEVAFKTKLGWELGKAFAGVHLDAPVRAALAVGWLESALVGGAMESEELVETISHAPEGTLGSRDKTIRPSASSTTQVVLTRDLLWNLAGAVKNVADSPSELAGRGVLRSRRRLDITIGYAAKAQKGCC